MSFFEAQTICMPNSIKINLVFTEPIECKNNNQICLLNKFSEDFKTIHLSHKAPKKKERI